MKLHSKSKILAVDDDQVNLSILEEIISGTYSFKSAETGEEALDLAEKFLPDIILLDIMLPDIDGLEICRRLRSRPQFAFTKILLLSAKTQLDDRLEGYGAGADDYLMKPFNSDELMAKIQVYIRLKSVEEIERLKDDLINIFSHVTRTPLNSIAGFANILQESANLDKNERDAVAYIRKNTVRLMDMVDKTIFLSNIRKEINSRRTECSLSELLNKSLELVYDSLESGQISVDNRLGAEVKLLANPDALVRAFVCLLDNAAKYSGKDGSIIIESETDDKGVYLSFIDSGKGIPEDKIDTLFTAFGVEDVSHHGRGHGLGLHIVSEVMRLLDGDVTAKNKPDGSGAVFTLTFPRKCIV